MVPVAKWNQILYIAIYNSMSVQIKTEQSIIHGYNTQLDGYGFVLVITWMNSFDQIIWDFNSLTKKF